MTRILYVGNFLSPWCTEVHVTRDLEALGHHVGRFQEPVGGGDADTVRAIGKSAVYGAAELVIYQKTWGLDPSATHLWRRLEARGIQTASYHLDLYLGLPRGGRRLAGDPFWTTGAVFSADGDPGSAETFKRLRIDHHWLPAGVVSDAVYRGALSGEFNQDVVFVGSDWPGYHKEWPWRRQLLEFLAARYGTGFALWPGRRPGGQVREARLNSLYATARIVVGDSLCLPGHRNYWSDRPYETVGRGGFLLMPHVPGLEAHFSHGVHLLFYEFGDLEGLAALIDAWLPLDEARRRITEEGMMHVKRHHTYRHRMTELLAVLGLT